jgi:hypothetical protein
MSIAGQLQPVMPVCSTPQLKSGGLNSVPKSCGYSPVRNTIPQVSLDNTSSVRSTIPQINRTIPPSNYTLPATGLGTIQLPPYQSATIPLVNTYQQPYKGEYSPRVQIQREVIAPQGESFLGWLFRF